MNADKTILLADQIILNIDESVRELMNLKGRVEKIKTDCSKLGEQKADVSTSALGNGVLTNEQLAALITKREKTRFKHNC